MWLVFKLKKPECVCLVGELVGRQVESGMVVLAELGCHHGRHDLFFKWVRPIFHVELLVAEIDEDWVS